MRARDLLIPLVFGLFALVAWPRWSAFAGGWTAGLPQGLALLGIWVSWRLALSPARAVVAAFAPARPKPSSRTHP